MVALRVAEGVSTGDFGPTHMRAIHRHLFQDVFDWAGDLRVIDIARNGSVFLSARALKRGLDLVHGEVPRQNYLRGLTPAALSIAASKLIANLSYLHPLRQVVARHRLDHGVEARARSRKNWLCPRAKNLLQKLIQGFIITDGVEVIPVATSAAIPPGAITQYQALLSGTANDE